MTGPPVLPSDDRPAPADPACPARTVLLRATEPATRALLELWLGEDGWSVAAAEAPLVAPWLALVEVAYPRIDQNRPLQELSLRYPGMPIVLLSPTLMTGTPSRGDVARRLGVAAVLPLPLARDTLLATVRELAIAPC